MRRNPRKPVVALIDSSQIDPVEVLAGILEISLEGILVADENLILAAVSVGAERLFGYGPGEAAAGPRARRRSRSVGPPIGTAGGACGGLDRLRLGLARFARSRSPTPAASSVPTEAPRPN